MGVLVGWSYKNMSLVRILSFFTVVLAPAFVACSTIQGRIQGFRKGGSFICRAAAEGGA